MHTAFSHFRKLHFTHLKRTVAIINILTLGLGHLAYPAQVWAKDVRVEQPTLTDPHTDVIKRNMVGVAEDINKLTLADDSASNTSAKRPIPVSVQELPKDDFKADEVVSMTVNNPDKDAFTTKVIDSEGEVIPVETRTVEHGNQTEVLLAGTNQFVPGQFTLEVTDAKGNISKQDFTWGVLAINTDKATYKPKETAAISMAVLDEKGEMVCDASVSLKITNVKANTTDILSTANNKIKVNKECSSKNFTLKPDYEAQYTVADEGTYTMELHAISLNGEFSITDSFEVKTQTPFEIKRTSATRLYPPLTYPMNIEVTANQDFEGTVTETVPESFVITPTDEKSSYDGVKTVYLDGQDPETKVLGASTASLQMPFDGSYSISQGFGGYLTDGELRNFYSKYGLSGHDGIDFALPMGTPLYAVDEGNVVFSGPGDYGITIIIQHAWGKSYYGHLSKTDVPTETHVTKGMLIGYSGNTGESTGPHLHFGMKPENPDMENGYAGKIDPLPYLNLAGNGIMPPALENAINSTGVLSATTSAAEEHQHDTPGGSEANPATSSAVPSTEPEPTLETPQPSVATSSAATNSVKAQPFTVLSQEIQTEVADSESSVTEKVKVIKWQVSLKKGEKTTLSYAYRAPQVSPQFYLLGSAKLFDSSKTMIYDDTRKWQLAADAVGTDWYDYSWIYRKPITIDHTEVVTSSPTVTFMEPGTDSTQNVEFYENPDSTVTSDCTTSVTGPCSLRLNTGAGATYSMFHQGGVASDTGTRISFYMKFDNFTNSGEQGIIELYQSDDSTFIGSPLTMGPGHILEDGSGNQGSTALQAGVWYRISMAYTITSTSVNQFRVYLNGNLEYTSSNVFLSATGSNYIRMGLIADANGANKVQHMDDIYIDNGSDLSDPGEVHVTAKRPNANGAANQFTTQVGSGGSGYGSGHAPQINERPVSGTNGWSRNVANQRENFGIENAATGDVDISSQRLIASQGWIYGRRNATSCTGSRITFNGTDTTITLGNFEETYVSPITTSSTYPSNAATIGMQSCTNTATISLLEAGVIMAYTSADSALTDFPVVITRTSDSDLSTKALANGNDILFTSNDGRTKLSHQIESYASGTLVAWVKIPSLSSVNDTTIYMYYGNPSAASQQSATSVWDSNYKAVYHMAETSGTTVNDSTSNANNGTASGFTLSTNTGQVGNSQNFDGGTAGNDKVTIPNSASLQDITESNFTYSAWASPDTNPNATGNNDYFVVGKRGQHTGIRFASSSTWFSTVYNTGGTAFGASTTPFAIGAFRYVVQTVNTATKVNSLYVDGIFRNSVTYTGNPRDYTTQASSIGQADINAVCSSNFAWCFDGRIDEVRMSNTVRSAAWIETEYNNQVAPGTFSSVGSEETKIYAPTNEELMRHGKFFDGRAAEQPFVF